MNKFFVSAAIASMLVASSAFMAPAMAEDIDVVIGSAAWDTNQDAFAGGYGTADVTIDAINIAALTSFTGLNTDDLVAGAGAFNVTQLAVAIGWSKGTCGGCGATVVDTSATNLAGIVIVDVKEVLSESSDTLAIALAGGVNQEAWAISVAEIGSATASATNIAGLVDVSIDVD